MLKKILMYLLTFTVMLSSLLTGMAFVSAETPTEITPYPYSQLWGQPLKAMFPGNVFWGDMIRVKGWGIPVEDPASDEAVNAGYMDSQHRISQFMGPDFVTGLSDPLSSIRYTQLDVKMHDGASTATKFEGFHNPLDPNYYRAGKFYGTFLGVRQDYAVLPAVPSRGLKETFIVKPGSYVATSLLFNSYTLNYSGGAYATMDQGWQFLSSPDGVTWTAMTPSLRWENGAKGAGIVYNNLYYCYYSVTASMKLPEGHIYYAVLSPADAGLEGANPKDTFAIGSTKVSSTSMDNGAYGDEYVDVYGPSTKQPLAITFDHVNTKAEIFADFDVKLDQITPLIDGLVKFFKEDGTTQILDGQSMGLAKKMYCYTKGGEKKLEYTVEVKPTGKTTISPTDTKKPLYPGIVDRLVSSYNYNSDPNKIYYNDYAEISGDIIMNPFNITEQFMGKTIPFAYFSTTGTGENDSIKYSILPSTYVATALIIHPGAMYKDTDKMDEQKAKTIGKSLKYEISADGVNWTLVDMTDSNFHLENTTDGAAHAAYVILKATFKAPANAYYYRITMNFIEVPSIWYLFVGPTKNSKTEMFDSKTGDEEVPWYEIPDVNSKSESITIDKSAKKITVSTLDDVTLNDFLNMLELTKLTYTFKGSNGSLINDLNQKLSTGMKIEFKVVGSSEFYGEFSLIYEKLEQEKEPGIESKMNDVLLVDQINKKIIIKKSGLTLQDVLDTLKLNGGVDVFFYDENDEMISDLAIRAKSNQYLEVYTSILLGTYKIEISSSDSNGLENPQTADNFKHVWMITALLTLLLVCAIAKKINTIHYNT